MFITAGRCVATRSAMVNKNDPKNPPAIAHTTRAGMFSGIKMYTGNEAITKAKDAFITKPPPNIANRLIKGFSTAKKNAVNIPTISSSVIDR